MILSQKAWHLLLRAVNTTWLILPLILTQHISNNEESWWEQGGGCPPFHSLHHQFSFKTFQARKNYGNNKRELALALESLHLASKEWRKLRDSKPTLITQQHFLPHGRIDWFLEKWNWKIEILETKMKIETLINENREIVFFFSFIPTFWHYFYITSTSLTIFAHFLYRPCLPFIEFFHIYFTT